MLEAIVTPGGRVLRAALPLDVPGIVALEAREDMRPFIGAWSAERHLLHLADPDFLYFVEPGEAGAVEAFVILGDVRSPHRWLELRRFALARPGGGKGSDILAGIVATAFDRLGAHRFQLDVYEDNARAIAVYERAGFRREGLFREAVERDGRRMSLVLMGLLAHERVRPRPAETTLR